MLPMRLTTCSALVLATLPAQSLTWLQAQPSPSPAARQSCAMATDTLRGRVLLFGGYSVPFALGDMWEWSNNTWTRLPDPPVPARWNHAMVYDSVRDRVVVFGGASNSSHLGDTWEWDGSNWTQAAPASPPPPRSGMGYAFEAHTARTVIFGGIAYQNGVTNYLADTWGWDGTTWLVVPAAQGPAGRVMSSLAYDEQRQRIVLHGGAYSDPTNSYYLADTWELVGSNWQPRVSLQFPNSWASQTMAYDAYQHRIVLFSGLQNGGQTGAVWTAQTWHYDGQGWTMPAPGSMPSPRTGACLAYDPARRQVVLFGGNDLQGNLGDTWTLGASPAAASALGSGCGSPALATTADNGSLPILGSTFASTTANVPASAVISFYAIGLSATQFGPFTLPLPLDGFGLPGCTLEQDLALGGFFPSVINANGTASHTVLIPSDASLVGVSFIQQPWVGVPGVNAGGMLTSNALVLRVGY